MRTKPIISGTHFYVYENNPNIGITKFFSVGTLADAQQLAGQLNAAFGVSDVPMTLGLVGGRLEMLPIEGVGVAGGIAARVPSLSASTTANRRGVKRGARKSAKRVPTAAASV